MLYSFVTPLLQTCANPEIQECAQKVGGIQSSDPHVPLTHVLCIRYKELKMIVISYRDVIALLTVMAIPQFPQCFPQEQRLLETPLSPHFLSHFFNIRGLFAELLGSHQRQFSSRIPERFRLREGHAKCVLAEIESPATNQTLRAPRSP